ncbi:hypothetical protein [Roseateles oligotrophus]|uniref:Uncharacterized protein n=1 Tax=Roseateles oligotrophus TaxID=1769250 RepID=A0ABT2YLB3_9BURK|nr:hypothetical protein [Roseateles oligotrophus]MCV2370726.1 hypothetical protein [Roseateles oligotrophus]
MFKIAKAPFQASQLVLAAALAFASLGAQAEVTVESVEVQGSYKLGAQAVQSLSSSNRQ